MTSPPRERPSSGPDARVAHLERALAAAEERLRTIAGIDPLTELLNRRGLQDALSAAVRSGGRAGLYALLVDLDDFRSVNDALGHVAGDVVLREVGRRLARAMPQLAIGRIGGDEFLAVLTEVDEAEGLRIAEAVRLAIADTTIALSSGPRRVTASVALTAIDDEMPSIDEVLTTAYLALQGSKRNGKNKVSATIADRPTASAVSRIVSDVRRGRGLRAVRQPIMSVPGVAPVAYELLTRSTVDVFEMPNDLFRIAHEANILTLVDHRCWRTCLAASAHLPLHARVNVNLFPSTLLAVPVEDLVKAIPHERPMSSYCVEISEQQIIGDPAYLLDAVRALRRYGLHIAIDDVGFGRTCLESLVLLEPEVVKIDRRCVTGAATDVRQRRALERLLSVARGLEAEVVAEGVETEDDLALVEELGVGLAQGFLWGRPESIREE